MTQLILSLFPGIGLLDMAFEQQGFCVVRGPDLLWGGDIRTFHPPAGRFDGVIGGPPCQCFSTMAHVVKARGYRLAENLIPEFERVLGEARPTWFLMENVSAAPAPNAPGYYTTRTILDARWVGSEQSRKRAFAFGHVARAVDLWRTLEIAPLEAATWQPAVMAGGTRMKTTGSRTLHEVQGPSWRTVEDAIRVQGLPEDFLNRFKEHAPLTAKGAQRMIGNGVDFRVGTAVAKAIRQALESMAEGEAA